MTDREDGIGELRITWRALRAALDLPSDVEVVGVECRSADTLDILLAGPGLPHVDPGALIPRVIPRQATDWIVYVEDDLRARPKD